jgi:hypothetical protein
MKIAFRKTNTPGFFPGLFNAYTRWSLKTDYAHGGVLIGDQLWHTTTKGVMPETINSLEEWDLFQTDVPDTIALERCTKVHKTKYDLASLLSFKLPIRITDSKSLYCFEFQWYVLTGEHPRKPISPDTIMAEILRKLNAQAHPTCTPTDWCTDCDRGLPDSSGARPCSMAAKHDLSNFGLANLYNRLNGNMGNT